jgi:chromosome partitioning protein
MPFAQEEHVTDETADDDLDVPGGRHSPYVPGTGKGSWLLHHLAQLGLTPADLAGGIITVAGYKGGIGKTMLAYEIAYLLGAVLLDLDWDRGNATVAWGDREGKRLGSPLLDAIDKGRVPRPLTGGPWRPDLVPCSSDFGDNQPKAETMTELIETWAGAWGREMRCPTVIDTHPGASPATFGAVAAAHIVVVPVVLGEREMEATEGMVEELKGYPLLLVPNKVSISPPERYISWLERIAESGQVPVGPPVSKNDWLTTRRRRRAITTADPVPARSRRLVDELHEVAATVVNHVRAAA